MSCRRQMARVCPLRTAVTRLFAAAILPAGIVGAAEHPWQHLTNPTAREVAAAFVTPPPEYAATVTWGWNGPMTEEVIRRDLDTLYARGFRAATIEAGYRMDNAPYLTEGWFNLIRFAAVQARERGMRLWIIDEGKYPSGFAGGRFTQLRPDLRMQGIAVGERIDVAAGETVERPLTPDGVGVIAVDSASGASRLLETPEGRLRFTAPAEGKWQLLLVDHQYRTGDTRAVNDPTQAKTTRNSMGDLLNPAAVRKFIEWTHEGYAQHMGDLFGTAILGFRGDEPDFAYTPWTPAVLAEFARRKGYDVRPYLAYFASFPRGAAGLRLTPEQQRAKADYWDVWSDLFARNFFQAQSEWCAAHGVEYMVHLNNDHDLFLHVRNSGDFFRNMRSVDVPGIDVIWSQIYPGRGPADFPKFASSAAHLYGHPRALSESFAAFRDPVTLDVARWVVNQQMARGISLFEFMMYPSSVPRPPRPAAPAGGGGASAAVATQGGADVGPGGLRGYMADAGFPLLAASVNRAQYLLAQGRPAAQIAVYAPTTSFWLGDQEANASMLKISQRLTEAQCDFDFADEQAIASVMALDHGHFTNLSGQEYRAVIIPSITAISRPALDRLRAFAQGGGRVISLGRLPALVVERTFLDAGGPADLDWAMREPSGEVTPAILAALPAPDVSLDQARPAVKYTHRHLRDAEVYFFFNEGKETLSCSAELAGSGTAELWDAATGRVETLAGTEPGGNGRIRVPLALMGGEAKFIVTGAAGSGRGP